SADSLDHCLVLIFQTGTKALEQRTGVSKLTEPEVFTRHGLGPVNRMFYDQKFTFVITNR
ncbi:MAG: hypothetical protein WCH99_13820, partial [Verrucomicrobiota bacterium]